MVNKMMQQAARTSRCGFTLMASVRVLECLSDGECRLFLSQALVESLQLQQCKDVHVDAYKLNLVTGVNLAASLLHLLVLISGNWSLQTYYDRLFGPLHWHA